jgi:AraC family transcriptional regulator
VFGETPFEYAARLRFDRAWRLVRDTRMPVCDITEALGFESQSAFCRAFKHAFGVTTTQARERHAAGSGRATDAMGRFEQAA